MTMEERLEAVKRCLTTFREGCDEEGMNLYFSKNPKTGSWGTVWAKKEELRKEDHLVYHWAEGVMSHNRYCYAPEVIAEWLGKLEES